MSDFYVEDILRGRATLRGRAIMAANLRREEEEDERRQLLEDLTTDVLEFFRDELEVSEDDLAALHFTSERQSGTRMRVKFTVDGLDFQATYSSTTPRELIVELRQGSKTPRIRSLTDLGMKLEE